MLKIPLVGVLSLALAGAIVATAATPAMAQTSTFPETIPLPDGFFPEGIAVGHSTSFYVGSLIDGTVLLGNLRNGEILGASAPLPADQISVGLAFDPRTNFVYTASGFGPDGRVAVLDGRSLELVENIELSSSAGFVNDVIVTRDAAFLTDSFVPVLYRLGLQNGLPDASDVTTLPLIGFDSVPGFNANGIVATPDDRWLVIVNSATGILYRVDPVTGVSLPIDLGGGTLVSGDGLVLSGRTLYVVQSGLGQVSVLELRNDFLTGSVQQVIVLPAWETPTTGGLFGKSLYVVDARFATAPGPDVSYDVTRIDK